MSSAEPAAERPRTPFSIGLARPSEVGRLVRFYLGLGERTRYHYHPFPFKRGRVTVIYTAITLTQTAFSWWMRRSPRSLVLLLVARRDSDGAIMGTGTLKGVVEPGQPPKVRFGIATGDDFRGLGVGREMLTELAATGLRYGVKIGIGSTFASDSKTVRVVSQFGFKPVPSSIKDPRAPAEANVFAEADLAELLRMQGRTPPA